MEKTLTKLCTYLRNWFNRGQYNYSGKVVIQGGNIITPSLSDKIQDGQYYTLAGSVFNDGVYKFVASLSSQSLKDETFSGTIRLMAIPQEVLDIVTDIDSWQAQYEAVDSPNMSPYTSESFGGYSYSKGMSTAANAGSSISWQDAFAARLKPWRKL